MKDRLLSTLGLCRKAGKLVMGFDAVVESMKLRQLPLVLLSEDLSPKTGKEILFAAGEQEMDIITAPITMEDIQFRLGKRSGVIGVADRGLADTVKRTVAACRANEEELHI